MVDAEALVRAVDVYPYRCRGRQHQFLVLKRHPHVMYGSTWRMVGGKILRGETGWQAALRELREETGQTPLRFWSLPSVNTFYEWETNRVTLAPAFAAELEADPVLDDEHVEFDWVDALVAADRVSWPEQRRLLHLADELLARPLAPEWIVPITT